MSEDAEIYSAVLRRLFEADHGWGQPYDFQALYILDQAVPNIEEEPGGGINDPEQGQPFGEALRSALQARLAGRPSLTFVQSFYDVYDAARPGLNQIREGGAYIALGPVYGNVHTAIVDAMFYGGHLWVRWIRYHLESVDGTWRIASSEVLAVS